jgi:4-carboxymuconolactone decarboxylase
MNGVDSPQATTLTAIDHRGEKAMNQKIGSDEVYQRGIATRSEIMDSDPSGSAFEASDDFIVPFQRLVGTYCWGEIWNREGLDRKTRSLLTVAMMAALNRPNELRLHLKGAINNGCSAEELRETMMHVAIYCGVPAGNEGLRTARDVLREKARL